MAVHPNRFHLTCEESNGSGGRRPWPSKILIVPSLLLPDRTAYQNDSSDDIEAENDDTEKIKESFDTGATRVAFEGQSKQWAANSPVTKFGYTGHRETIETRDDYFTDIKIYHPSTFVTPSAKLRLLFVIYGGGWTIGKHHAEEMLLLRPIMQNLTSVSSV